jgi:hypothetical protein
MRRDWVEGMKMLGEMIRGVKGSSEREILPQETMVLNRWLRHLTAGLPLWHLAGYSQHLAGYNQL